MQPDPARQPPDIAAVAGLARHSLSPAGVERIAGYLAGRRHPSGGYRNRAGRPDLYYTVFGLGGLMALARAIPGPDRIRAFLDGFTAMDDMSFVNLVSLMRCYRHLALLPGGLDLDPARRQAIVRRMLCYRSRDGGFSHETPGAAHSTLYALFLAEQAGRDFNHQAVNPRDMPRLLKILKNLQTPDGGYANHAGASRGIATATATAAILLLRGNQHQDARAALAFLDKLSCPEGGYRAAPGTRLPDLLSTATALFARAHLAAPASTNDLRNHAAFVERLWSDNGGFRGHPADGVTDAEYTFYALASLGAIQLMREKNAC